MSDKEKIIIDAMQKVGKPMGAGDIADVVYLEKTDVSKIINKMKKEGRITSPKRCFYAPVDG